ncbi:MAG: hypothetical protein FJ041_00055 [Candidatus Cloacimonetes bacterium]|nr:hypothetical protein [Candidatus Cloacimonadota bacterium]
MVDININSDIRLETATFQSVLDGLIHNVNTHLNIILGYSQQLAKQYPDIEKLIVINEAGLQIDNIISSSSKHLQQILKGGVCEVNLVSWMRNELLYLSNILELKHTLQISFDTTDEDLYCIVSPYLLAFNLERFFLFLVRKDALNKDHNCVSIKIEKQIRDISLIIQLSLNKDSGHNLTEYLDVLNNETESKLIELHIENHSIRWNIMKNNEFALIINHRAEL